MVGTLNQLNTGSRTMENIKENLDPIKRSKTIKSPTKLKEKRPFTVVVEGNIGSGKTTFLEHFSAKDIVEVVTEPVEEWRNVGGHNLLQLMYENPSRWSHIFQSYVQLTMTKNHVRKLSSSQVCKLIEYLQYLIKEGLLSVNPLTFDSTQILETNQDHGT